MENINELAENLREDYYTVGLYTEGEEDMIESLLIYGSPMDIVSTMDATLINAGYEDEDWSKMSACISYETGNYEYSLLYMSDLTGPEYEVMADREVLEALAA